MKESVHNQKISFLENKINELEKELIDKDVVINKLCERFFNIKNSLNRKLLITQQEHKAVVDDLICKLEEAYDDINEITEEILFYSIPANSANFLRTLSKNGQLVKENRLLNEQIKKLQEKVDEFKKELPHGRIPSFPSEEAAWKLRSYKSYINAKKSFTSKINLRGNKTGVNKEQEENVIQSHSLPLVLNRDESGCKEFVQMSLSDC